MTAGQKPDQRLMSGPLSVPNLMLKHSIIFYASKGTRLNKIDRHYTSGFFRSLSPRPPPVPSVYDALDSRLAIFGEMVRQ